MDLLQWVVVVIVVVVIVAAAACCRVASGWCCAGNSLHGVRVDLTALPDQPPLGDVLSTVGTGKYALMNSVSADGGVIRFLHSDDLKTVCAVMLHQTMRGHTISSERVREKIGGVVWMQGNPAPETLACFNYSVYSEASGHRLLVTPIHQRCHWAWPEDASWGYRDLYMSLPPQSKMCSSVEFEGEGLDNPNIWLHDTYDDLGSLMKRGGVGLNRFVKFPSTFVTPQTSDGFELRRRTIWCGCVEFGTYTARQIMTNEGVPIQPAFDECQAHIRSTGKRLQLFAGTDVLP
jgi:hypothetical protein